MFHHLSEAKWPDHIAWADGPGWLAAYLFLCAVAFVAFAVAETRSRRAEHTAPVPVKAMIDPRRIDRHQGVRRAA